VSLTSSDADSLDTGFTELPPSCRPVADGLDRRRFAAQSAAPDRRYHHVAAYAAAFLFAVLVAAVYSFVFSWPYKQ